MPDDFALDEPALDLPADFSWDVGVLSVLVELGLGKKKSQLDWSKVTKHCTLFIIEKLLQFLTDESLFNFDMVALKEKETNLDDFEFSGSFLVFTKKKNTKKQTVNKSKDE